MIAHQNVAELEWGQISDQAQTNGLLITDQGLTPDTKDKNRFKNNGNA